MAELTLLIELGEGTLYNYLMQISLFNAVNPLNHQIIRLLVSLVIKQPEKSGFLVGGDCSALLLNKVIAYTAGAGIAL